MNPSYQNGTQQQEGRATRALREKVTFETNIPQALVLEFNPPTEASEGNWGPQYRYFCADNRIAFLDPPVHEKLLELGAHAGEMFAIVKRKNGRLNRWEVNRVENGHVIPNTPALVSQPLPRQAPAPQPPPPPAPDPAPAPKAKASSTPTQLSGADRIGGNLMSACIRQAIEAAEANEWAATHEDIRALAISIYISATGARK